MFKSLMKESMICLRLTMEALGRNMKDRYVSMREIIGGTQAEGRKGRGRGEAHGIVGTGICGGCVHTAGL